MNIKFALFIILVFCFNVNLYSQPISTINDEESRDLISYLFTKVIVDKDESFLNKLIFFESAKMDFFHEDEFWDIVKIEKESKNDPRLLQTLLFFVHYIENKPQDLNAFFDYQAFLLKYESNVDIYHMLPCDYLEVLSEVKNRELIINHSEIYFPQIEKLIENRLAKEIAPSASILPITDISHDQLKKIESNILNKSKKSHEMIAGVDGGFWASNSAYETIFPFGLGLGIRFFNPYSRNGITILLLPQIAQLKFDHNNVQDKAEYIGLMYSISGEIHSPVIGSSSLQFLLGAEKSWANITKKNDYAWLKNEPANAGSRIFYTGTIFHSTQPFSMRRMSEVDKNRFNFYIKLKAGLNTQEGIDQMRFTFGINLGVVMHLTKTKNLIYKNK
jgi:hypothetical protein